MDISLEGRVAIVTGAGRGLGRSYAIDLAKRGAKVIINDLGGSVAGEGADLGPAAQVCEEIKAAGGEAIPNGGSVASYEDAYELVKQAMDTWGRVDIVVANAGILRDKAFHNMAEDEWDAVVAVHLKGAYNVLRHAWPVFRQQAYGRVVLATSSSGIYGNFGQSNYGAAKTGMLGLMNVLKIEGQKYNVGVNCIAPVAATRMTETLMGGERVSALSPEHVVPAVTYLCSEQCTDTGLVIEAGGSGYNRAAIVRGPVVPIDGEEVKTAEWLAERWESVVSLEGSEPMWDIGTTRKAKGVAH